MATTAAAAQPGGAAPFKLGSIMVPLVAIIIGVFMVVLDTTAVNVAVPKLVLDFNDKLSTLQWVITGYTLAQAAMIPLTGWLSDRFGAKRIFLISVVLFTVGSALCATSQSTGMLIAFRVLQGLGGGFVLPVAMAYVYRLAPPDKVGIVMGMMGIPILFAPAVGPVLAGWLVEFASWRWIFLINVPIGVVGVVIGLRGLPAIGRSAVAALDIPGFVLAPLAFVGLSFGVSEGATSWTSINTIGGLVIGALALVGFVIAELRAENPLLELRVFRSFDFSLAIITQWVGQFALFGTLFIMPLFLQQIRGYGAFDTGLSLLPQAIAAGIFMPIGGMLFDRFGARPVVMAGSGLMGIAAIILAQVGTGTQGKDLIAPLAMYGVGMGLMLMPLNTHLINAAPRKLVSRVTSLTNALQQVVSSFTIAGLSTFLTSRPSYHTATAQLQAAQAHGSAAGAAQSSGLPGPIAGLFSSAFDDTFMLMAVVALLGAAMGLALRRNLAAQSAAAAEEDRVELPTAVGAFPG